MDENSWHWHGYEEAGGWTRPVNSSKIGKNKRRWDQILLKIRKKDLKFYIILILQADQSKTHTKSNPDHEIYSHCQ